MAQLVKPAERIGELKVLNVTGGFGGGSVSTSGNGEGHGAGANMLGNALGPVAKTIIEASAVMPLVKELLRFAGTTELKDAVSKAVPALAAPLEKLTTGRGTPPPAPPPRASVRTQNPPDAT